MRIASFLVAAAFAWPASAQDFKTTIDNADSDMAKVLESYQKLNPKPINTLTPEEARKQPTMADAVKARLAEDGETPEAPKVRAIDAAYPAAGGLQPAKIYIPMDADDEKLPVIVYYRGGGFVIADIATYEATAMSMAEKAEAIVVSIEYRRAPEHMFPAAHEDAFAGYKWVLSKAESWGGDPRKVGLLGESAGGNLAANVAIMARDNNVNMPVHMVLVYPIADTDMNTESYKENANAVPLGRPAMEWFAKTALGEEGMRSPMINLVKANLKGLPSATIITAELDPLLNDGEKLRDALEKAGVEVDYEEYNGSTHEFFGMAAVVDDADDAQDWAAKKLRRAFDRVKDKPRS
jgi:acetyl esterase/lipase